MSNPVFKIMPPTGGKFNAVNYNAKKQKQGVARLIHFENFGFLQNQEEISRQEFIDYLKNYSKRNSRIKNPVFHAVCSIKGWEMSHEELKDIALEIICKLGYGDNPILVYAHDDTGNNHVHVVTCRVGVNGKKIDHSFEKKRANHYLNALINRNPTQEFNRHLNEALGYRFGTIAQFSLLMESQGYTIKQEERKLQFYKHGERLGEIAKADIDKKISGEAQTNKEKVVKQIRALIYKYHQQYSPALRSNKDYKFTDEKLKFSSDLTEFLKEKFGLEFIFFAAPGHLKPYGYTLIDHHRRRVFKGSEIFGLTQLIKSGVNENPISRLHRNSFNNPDRDNARENEGEKESKVEIQATQGDILSDLITQIKMADDEYIQRKRRKKK